MTKKTAAAVILILITAAVIFTAGCVSDTQNVQPEENQTQPVEDGTKTAASGDLVSVHYTLSVNGTVQESNVGKKPLEFTLGSGATIKGFNNAVIGMKEGETKTVTVSPEDGYGIYTREKNYELPLSDVEEVVGAVEEGQILYLNNGQMTAEILKIDRANDLIEAAVNHQMAGKTLVFEIILDTIEK
ncbi:MAG TPA: FKBP-type peptidyl-prolyl cis-trans isomerase [Methanocorpusculum sp.]|nr:FKBP-type peptidyl-prolyl cis-trans isomerase [Methanocorpusculum sp.]